MRKQQYFSFPGGMVSDLDSVLQLTSSIGLNQTNTPPLPSQLITNNILRFAFQEIYSWSSADDPNIPLEFIFKPSTYRIYEWFFESDESLYLQVAEFFGKN